MSVHGTIMKKHTNSVLNSIRTIYWKTRPYWTVHLYRVMTMWISTLESNYYIGIHSISCMTQFLSGYFVSMSWSYYNNSLFYRVSQKKLPLRIWGTLLLASFLWPLYTYRKVFIFKIKVSIFCLSYIQKLDCRWKGAGDIKHSIKYPKS